MSYPENRNIASGLVKRRTSLLITSALTVSAFSSAVSHAGTVTVVPPVAPATSTPAATVNTSIAANPDADLTLDIKAGAVITGGQVSVIPAGGAPATINSGTIVVTNNGSVGTLDGAGAVTDASSVFVSGVGLANAKNAATMTNAGTVTGLFGASNLGGDATVTNTGIVSGSGASNSLFAAGFGNNTVTNSAGAEVNGGSNAQGIVAFSFASSKTDAGVTTITGGNATAVSDGRAANKDGSVKVGVLANASIGTATTSVNNVAGSVSAFGGTGASSSTAIFKAAVADATTTTVQTANVQATGAATATVGAKGDTLGVQARSGGGSAKAEVAGKVTGSVSASTGAGGANNTFIQTITQDAAAVQTGSTSDSTSAAVGGAATVIVSGSVTGDATANVVGTGAALADITGSVGGALNVTSSGRSTTNSTKNTNVTTLTAGPPATSTTVTTNSSKFTEAATGGAATATIGSAGSVKLNVLVSGDAGATAANNGQVGGNVQVSSTGSVTALTQSSGSSKFFNDGTAFTSDFANSFESQEAAFGGTAALSNGVTGKIAGQVDVSGTKGAAVTNDGAITGSVNAVSALTITQSDKSASKSSNAFDGKTSTTSSESTSSFQEIAAGAVATVTNTATGKIGGSVFVSGDGAAVITNAGRITGSATLLSNDTISTSSNSSKSSSESNAAGFTSKSTTSSSQTTTVIGGTAVFTNDASGVVEGSVSASSKGDVTIVNNGSVRGATNATSSGSTSTNVFNSSADVKSVAAVAPALGSFTQTTTSAQDFAQSSTGGSVTGTYAGVNGAINFDPRSNGPVFQNADKASTATVSGVVIGDVVSNAGLGSTQTFKSATNETRNFDDAAQTIGTVTGGDTTSSTFTENAGGDSVVTVAGGVRKGDLLGAASVFSNGSSSSKVTVSGTVEGDVSSNASLDANTSTDTRSYVQKADSKATPAFGLATTSAVRETTNTFTQSAGAASVDLTGSGKTTGSVFVSGVSSASVNIASGASVGGNLTAQASGFDSSGSRKDTYDRDPIKTTFTTTRVTTNKSGPAAASGNATVVVAGSTTGAVEARADRGNASVTINGKAGSVLANARDAAATESSDSLEWAGKIAPTTTTDAFAISGTGAATLTKRVQTSSSTAVGGSATVLIDTSQANKDLGITSVAGNAEARGLAGASVTVTAGSKVGGSVIANSQRASTTLARTTTFVPGTGAQATLDQTDTSTIGGAAATITNAGNIGGSAQAFGRTSGSVANSGTVGGSAQAFSIGSDFKSVLASKNRQDVVLREDVTTATDTAWGGNATVSNAASGIIFGGVAVGGSTGTVTNDGVIGGTTTVGSAVANGAVTTTQTDTQTTKVTTPAASLFKQAYTVNQNGTSGGIIVTGANVGTTKTSEITATINLNSGSATLGGIDAQRDTKGLFLTNTTVNLNGSGFLGADIVNTTTPANLLAPELTLSKLAQTPGLGFGSTAVRVLGVTTLNKTGAGTFVINGANYVPAPAGTALPPTWTMDVGQFNINGGEIQLATPAGVGAEFGIKGNVTNNATLVIGRRRPIAPGNVGDSLVSSGSETIGGITVRQTGNFTQSATGTTVVGVNPSLVRVGGLGVTASGGGATVLAPVSGSIGIGRFTTPTPATNQSTPSRWNVTGDLSLAGKIVTDINRNSVFAAGDGYVLFTYTGAGTVTATVEGNLTSKFVTLGLKHDTAAKTVSLAAARNSYITGANNPNAISAAAALDTALTAAISGIKSDASGGAAFNSVAALGNAQDVANIASALDWRLNANEAAQVFNELSSAEFYGSLSAIDQNLAFGQSVAILAGRRSADGDGASRLGAGGIGARLWVNPVGNFAKYGDEAQGQSRIKVNSYGGAFGLDVGYSEDGAFGFGFGYTEHDATARGTAEQGDGQTYTLGAYATQGFGNIYANASFAYGFSKFDTVRNLALLARSVTAEFKGNQWDGSLEVGYDFRTGRATITPFLELAARGWSFNGFTEQGGAGIGLIVEKASKTVFNPTLGAKFTTLLGDADGFSIRPFGKLAYTFQGNIGNDRTVQYLAGGSSFQLFGSDPDGHGQIELGVDASVNNRVGIFLSGGTTFSGQQKVGRIQGGFDIRF